MPTYVLLVGCNGILRDTATRLVGLAAHHAVAVPDLASAINALSGIQFDVLVIGDIPFDASFAAFLATARSLQNGLRVVDAKTHAGRTAPAAVKPGAAARRRAGDLLTAGSAP